MESTIMGEYIEILPKIDLFAGIAPKDIESILCCLDTHIKKYEKNDMVLWEGDIVDEIGVVISGHGRSIKTDITGRNVIVTLLQQGSYIGVLLAASMERRSPVSVQATDNLIVLFIPFNNILKRCSKICPRHDRLLYNVLDGIAEKALVLHDRNDCLIKPTIREKVLTFLTRIAKEQNSNSFTIPFDRKSMAEYLNVERSALSRELSRMKKAGIIDYNKNKFKVFYNVEMVQSIFHII